MTILTLLDQIIKENKLAEELSVTKSIIITATGNVFNGNPASLLEIRNFRILKGNYNKTVIFYRDPVNNDDDASADDDCDNYVLFYLEDFQKTWGFTQDDLLSWRHSFLADLSSKSLTEKVDMLLDPAVDHRFNQDIRNSVVDDILALEATLTQEV